jgi:hypothetical protein
MWPYNINSVEVRSPLLITWGSNDAAQVESKISVEGRSYQKNITVNENEKTVISGNSSIFVEGAVMTTTVGASGVLYFTHSPHDSYT